MYKKIYILVHLKKCSLLFTLTQFMFTLFTFHEKKVIATMNLSQIAPLEGAVMAFFKITMLNLHQINAFSAPLRKIGANKVLVLK